MRSMLPEWGCHGCQMERCGCQAPGLLLPPTGPSSLTTSLSTPSPECRRGTRASEVEGMGSGMGNNTQKQQRSRRGLRTGKSAKYIIIKTEYTIKRIKMNNVPGSENERELGREQGAGKVGAMAGRTNKEHTHILW